MTQNTSILRGLGVVGWESLEPAILSALATESTLLLIGEHGTAKSMLLENIATALQVQFRHYNASTINFDDLIGFPAPDGDRIKYLRTPLDAWSAQAIFIDEISRCRADMQNRLFPLVHEKKLQGKKLADLKFRWAAMNPPPSEEEPNSYYGAQPLAAAFADRFSWILPVPNSLSMPLRIELIKGIKLQEDIGERIQLRIREIKGRLHLTEQVYGENIALFIDSLYSTLLRHDIKLSLRRCRYLYHNCIAMMASGYYESLSDALFYGFIYGLPERTERKLNEEMLLRTFQTSLKMQALPIDDIRRRLLEERDPVQRIVYALPSQNDELVTATILDAYASLTEGEQLALSSRLFPLLIEEFPDVSALVLETLAENVGKIASLQRVESHIYTNSRQYQLAQQVTKICANVTSREVWIEDVLWTAYRQETEDHPQELFQFCRRIEDVFSKANRRSRVGA